MKPVASLVGGVGAVMFGLTLAQAQRVVTGGSFTPAANVLFATTFSQDSVGSFPSGLKFVRGPLDVVLVDGVPMLRAIGEAEFQIPLGQPLPQDFTLEFDLIPKAGNGDDLTIEGGPVASRGSVSSAEIRFNHQIASIMGGGQGMSQVTLPHDLQAELINQRSTVQLAMNGTRFKLFVNGRQIYNVQNLAFRRAAALRVFVGGRDDASNAVYVARIRLATSGQTAVAVVPIAPPTATVTPMPPPSTATQSSGSTGTPAPTFVSGITVTPSPAGPLVNWLAVAAPATYTVQRWKIDDLTCCNNASPASPALTGPPWQDAQLPLLGTYVYQVTVTTASGTASGQAQFVHLQPAGQPVGNAPSSGPRPVTASPGTVPTSPAATGSGPGAGFTMTVALGGAGPVASWTAAPVAGARYTARRWKIDDLACCNNQTPRLGLATTTWQDTPLPMPGTYVYEVTALTSVGNMVAQTQLDFQLGRRPASPTIAVVPVANPSGTITPSTPPPPPPLGRPPAGATAPTVLGTAAGPTNLSVTGTPTSASLDWTPVPGAIRYLVDRAVAGNSAWTGLAPDPTYPDRPYYQDFFPAPATTFTYQVRAFQADGTFGAAVVNFTPPAPTDPTGFTASVVGPGEVLLRWDVVPGVTTYLIAGPGTGTGVSAIGSATQPGARNSYTITGLPPGTHAWTIASVWQPGGVLTASTAWPTATATMVSGGLGPRYRLVALGIKAVNQSKDINDPRDGRGDEVYFGAVVNQTTLTNLPLPVTNAPGLSLVMTRSLGDQAVSVPYGRIQAGTASATGGIQTGDLVPATLDPLAPTGSLHTSRFPILVWEGELDSNTVVVVHPTLWEDDVDPVVQAIWAKQVFDEARSGYVMNGAISGDVYGTYPAGVSQTASANIIYDLVHARQHTPPLAADIINGGRVGNVLLVCTTADVSVWRRPCETHGVDRPLGLGPPIDFGVDKPLRDRLVVLTKTTIEQALSRPFSLPYFDVGWVPGTFAIALFDDRTSSPDPADQALAYYELYFRVERLP